MVADALRGRKAEDAGATGEFGIEDDGGTVVTGAGGGGGGAAVGADKGVNGGPAEAVARALTQIEAGLQGDGNAPREIAGDVGVGTAFNVVGDVVEAAAVLGISTPAGEGITGESIGIDEGAGRSVGHGDAARTKRADLVERDGDAGALGRYAAEIAAGKIAGDAAGAGVAGTGFYFPEGAGMAVDEGCAQVGGVLVAVGIGHGEAPAAGETVGVGRPEISNEHPVDAKREVAAAVIAGEGRTLHGEGKAVGRTEFIIDGGAGGRATRLAGEIAEEVVAEIRFIGRGRGQETAIGPGGGGAPRRLHKRRGLVLGRGAAGEGEAETGVDGFHVGEFEAGIYFACGAAPGAGGGVNVARVVPHQDVGAGVEEWPGAVKGAAGNHVDRAGESHAR